MRGLFLWARPALRLSFLPTLAFLLLFIFPILAQPTVTHNATKQDDQGISPRALHQEDIRTWPKGRIPYCFIGGQSVPGYVPDEYRKLFTEGARKWNNTNLGVKFEPINGETCPTAKDKDYERLIPEILVVRALTSKQSPSGVFWATSGYRGRWWDGKDTPDPPQLLHMPIESPLYSQKVSRFKKEWKPKSNDRFATYIARTLGLVIGLEYEHMRYFLDEAQRVDSGLQFDFRNLVNYDKYDAHTKANLRILQLHGNPELLRYHLKDIAALEYYMPEHDRGNWLRSDQYDWNSIMSCDGTEFAKKGMSVMRKNDNLIDISRITEPSDNDKTMVKKMYARA